MAAEDWFDVWDDEYFIEGYEDRSKKRRSSMTRWRKPDKWVDFEGVLFRKRTEKSWLCVFEDGTERFVPISQTPDDFDPEEGSRGTLTVTEWIANKWEEDGPPEKEEAVTLEGATCLRETDRAIQVRVGDRVEWLPKSKIMAESEVQGDGDMGKLVLDPWIAKEKGFGPDAPVSYERVAQDVGRERARGGPPGRKPAREAAPRQQGMDWSPPPDPDDDIPF